MLQLLSIFLAQSDFKLSFKKELNGEYDFLKEKFLLFKNIFKYFIVENAKHPITNELSKRRWMFVDIVGRIFRFNKKLGRKRDFNIWLRIVQLWDLVFFKIFVVGIVVFEIFVFEVFIIWRKLFKWVIKRGVFRLCRIWSWKKWKTPKTISSRTYFFPRRSR